MNADAKKQAEEFWKNAQQMKLPANFKEAVEEGLVKSQEVYENAKLFAKDTETAFETVAKTTEKGAKDLTSQVFKNVEENADAACKAVHELVHCKDREDAAKIQSEFVQGQFAKFQSQLQELNALAGNISKDTAEATKS
ncbi:MAG: phasin family protein, partial [Desulfobulbia bacterium]